MGRYDDIEDLYPALHECPKVHLDIRNPIMKVNRMVKDIVLAATKGAGFEVESPTAMEEHEKKKVGKVQSKEANQVQFQQDKHHQTYEYVILANTTSRETRS